MPWVLQEVIPPHMHGASLITSAIRTAWIGMQPAHVCLLDPELPHDRARQFNRVHRHLVLPLKFLENRPMKRLEREHPLLL